MPAKAHIHITVNFLVKISHKHFVLKISPVCYMVNVQ